MRKLLTITFLIIISFECKYLLAQKSNITFEHFSIPQGMSSLVISSIIQDHEGYMWFGTYNGLDKYDGYNFKSYKHDPQDSTTINNGYIQTLFEDRSGNIWIGTSEGLDKLDRASGKVSHYFPYGNNIKMVQFGLQQATGWINTIKVLNRLFITGMIQMI